MALFRRRSKRRPPDQWPPHVIAGKISAAYISDPDRNDVRAAAVFHLDPDLAPENMDELAEQEAEEMGVEHTGVVPWFAFKLEFVDDEEGSDRVGLYMDFDPTVLIRDHYGCKTLLEANDEAREWVGKEAVDVGFRGLPGVFQLAIMTSVTGREFEPHTADVMWAPKIDGDVVAVRRFPPPVHGSEADAEEEDGPWNLLPRAAVEEMLANRGW